jgi:pimeloyl-ACP methyl ester carboxylesterase
MYVEDRSVFELPYAKPDETIAFGKSEDQVIDFYLPPVPVLTIPTTLTHGTLDLRVPINFSREYVAQKTEPNVHFLEFENLGHFELIDPS